MKTIDTIKALEEFYDAPLASPLSKVQNTVTPKYKSWFGQSRFVVLTTVGLEGTDASPCGDKGPVATIEADHTLLLPDWRGHNRLDSLSNIVRDGRISLMFMVPGCPNVVRVNGNAVLSADAPLLRRFEIAGKKPKTVIVVTLAEVYFQCAKALMRSEFWSGEDQSATLPAAGDFICEFTEGFDAKVYDDGYADYAKDRMW